jgi:SAM-dependent methyltransferase
MIDIEQNITENRESFTHSMDAYFAQAETWMDSQWQGTIWPFIRDFDFTVTVDLACGHGRNAAKLLPLSRELHLVDVTPACVEACRRRLADVLGSRVWVYLNDGKSLPRELTGRVTCVYSWDAMVHFDLGVVEKYLAEIARVLRPGGSSFLHHSDLRATPHLVVGPWRDNPHWRSAMSRDDLARAAERVGLTVVQQKPLPWGEIQDCVTVLRK